MRAVRVRRSSRQENAPSSSPKAMQDLELVARSLPLGKPQQRADVSRQVQEEDAYDFSVLGDGVIIATPYDLPTLSRVISQSSIIPQCIQSIVTNVTSYGYRIVAVDDEVSMSRDETRILKSFISSPNVDESLAALQAKKTADYEKYGHAYIEVIRDATGRPSLLRQCRAINMRILTQSGDLVPVTTNLLRGGKRAKVTELRRFRAYVQLTASTRVFYKELGDPRRMDYTSGKYETAEHPVPDDRLATEILHERQYSDDSYGVPRWVSVMPAILGSRESEEVNLRYFEDNTVPPMILTVAGGRLTRQSFTALSKLLQAQGVGKERQHKILLLEAVPDSSGLDDKGAVSLRVDKLTDARQSDGLFADYDKANMDKIRSTFRLPETALGQTSSANIAVANVSLWAAETQVYAPQRKAHDEFLNHKFVNHPAGLGLKTVKLESCGPSVTIPDQVIRMLTAINVMGGVTPRSAIDVLNQTMQMTLPQYPEKGAEGWEEWMDTPMPLSLRGATTQQTGKGENTQTEQASKTGQIKQTEVSGTTGVEMTANQPHAMQ